MPRGRVAADVPPLTVDLNRENVHAIEAPDEYAATGGFTVELVNHGQPVHVHLHLDDALSRVASLSANNHYVEREGSRGVAVHSRGIDEPVAGRLKIVTGYGNRTAYVTVTVEPSTPDEGVTVDESLASPGGAGPSGSNAGGLGSRSQSRSRSGSGPTNNAAPALALAAAAALLAAGVGLTVDSRPVTLAAGVVIGGALAATFLLVR